MRTGFLLRWGFLFAGAGLTSVGCGGVSDGSGGEDGGADDASTGKDGGGRDGSMGRDGGGSDAPGGEDASGPGTTECGVPASGTIGELSDEPVAIAVNGCDVYVADFLGGIVKMPMSGAAISTLVASAGSGVYFQNQFVIQGGKFFFSESSGGAGMSGPIASAPLGGGTAKVLATSSGFTSAIAVDESFVYWVAQDDGAILKVPVGGGKPVTLASSLKSPAGLALADGTLYFTNPAGDLLSLPAVGGAPKTLFTGPGLAPHTEVADWSPPIVVDQGTVYFSVCAGLTAAPSSTLYAVSRSSGMRTALAASCARGIAVDATAVYWTDGTHVSSAPLTGGAAKVLYSGPSGVSAGPVLDATSVYWAVTKQVGTCGLCPPPAPGQFNGVLRAPK